MFIFRFSVDWLDGFKRLNVNSGFGMLRGRVRNFMGLIGFRFWDGLDDLIEKFLVFLLRGCMDLILS